MRAIVTGQVGVDKRPFLEALQAEAARRGHDLHVCHVGSMMYAEAPDVPAGRILNLPINRLNALRRSVFREILRLADRHPNLLVNTHATFRWKHGLFSAFDFDQMKAFNAGRYVTILDNVENVHQRLLRDHDIDHSLKDIMVWREEELLATEIIANITLGFGNFFMVSRGHREPTIETMYRLLFEPQRKKAYLSFPMTHVADRPQIQGIIDQFKRTMREHFTCFDPSEVDEYLLHTRAIQAMQDGRTTIEVDAAEGRLSLKTADVAQISGDILGQIYARDFKMIDQSDLILSIIPELPDGHPGLSSGVERELHHAFETGKEVYILWMCRATPSPFITETATRVFNDLPQAIAYFTEKGLVARSSEPPVSTGLFPVS
jgi:adenylate kinase